MSAAAAPIHITSVAEYQKHINCGKVFFATWCGPCRAIAPKFVEFAAKFTNAVFLKIDVDEIPEVSESAGVSAMPTFHVYKNGQKVGELIGADAKKLEALVTQHAA